MSVLEDDCTVAMDEELNPEKIDSVSPHAEGFDGTNISTINTNPGAADMEPLPDNVLFVGNLPFSADDELLHLVFEYYGTVKSIATVYEGNTVESSSHGFIEFETKQACEKSYFHIRERNTELDGYKLYVEYNAFSPGIAKLWSDYNQQRGSSSDASLNAVAKTEE